MSTYDWNLKKQMTYLDVNVITQKKANMYTETKT